VVIVMYKYFLRCWFNEIWQKKLRYMFSAILYCGASVSYVVRARRLSLSWCMQALRYSATSGAILLLKKIMKENLSLIDDAVSKGVKLEDAASRTIVLKWPAIESGQVTCKGMMLIKFTKTFSYALRNLDVDRLSQYFYVILEPSWSGYADADILAWVGKSRDVVIQASEVQDRALMNCFPGTFKAVSFGSGNWVPSYDFKEINVDKEFDSIYIANTSPIKRVGRYIDAIKKIVDSGNLNYKGCLVCASWGESEHLIEMLVRRSGIENNLALLFSLTKDEVIHVLNRSKCNVLLSYKEGSNRSLFEAMFCNVPVITLVENVGINKEYISEQSGLLVPDEALESTMIWMSENYQSFSPRSWAMENISYEKSMEKLLSLLYRKWMFDSDCKGLKVYKKVNAPEAFYENTSTNFPGLMMELLTLFHRTNQICISELIERLALLEKRLDSDIRSSEMGLK
jgi:glycosyltransferase involved in cell wall biosynthesis